MPIRAQYCKHTLNFKFDAGTSRGVLKKKDSYFLKLYEEGDERTFGIGEAGPLYGLSSDFGEVAYQKMGELVAEINKRNLISSEFEDILHSLGNYPSVYFALETALCDLRKGGKRQLFENGFYPGSRELSINGLIWMGEKEFMAAQIRQKLQEGYDTIKMKIGAIDFQTEIDLLKSIRAQFNKEEITLRVDANGAFHPSEALKKLEILAKLDIHSIEQPIRQGQPALMRDLCLQSPVPVALDEELIGTEEKETLLDSIKPQFLILKPTLLGGFEGTSAWIRLAEKHGIGWWITSALESNIGLNAICQFTAQYDNLLPQGLGTGQLYTNNIESPLSIESGKIRYNQGEIWDLSLLNFHF